MLAAMTDRDFSTTESRWQALVDRDAVADGTFYYAVVTTGVFCRPSCASRRPLRDNVRFFDAGTEAARAGYRACKRCRPLEANPREAALARIVEACRLLESEAGENVDAIARRIGLSPFYFRRLFRREVGVTPKEYRRRVTAERAKSGLRSAPSITTAIYDAGYSSSSRFYDGAARELGMTPASARRGAAGEGVLFTTRDCTLGVVLIAWTARGVCDVRFGEDEASLAGELRERFAAAVIERRPGNPAEGSNESSKWVDLVVESIEGSNPSAGDIPLDIRGTAFQQRVWKELQRIPRGQTRSYSEVADAIGAAGSARAVAQACAANRLACVIPCHRVVRRDKKGEGYRWGRERKRTLLEREAAALS